MSERKILLVLHPHRPEAKTVAQEIVSTLRNEGFSFLVTSETAVDGVVFDKDFARVAGIGVQDDTFTIGDRVAAGRRNQLGVTEDQVAAYDVMDTSIRVQVR